jgi:hypothetical protein
VLFAFRFIVVAFIAFLLLSPLVKTSKRTVEKPIIIIAQDQSQSVLFNNDSVYYKSQYPEKLNKFISNLKSKYDVKTYSFGANTVDGIDYKFSEKATDFSDLFEQLKTKYVYRNVGALVIASDGLYNSGRNPLYASDFINYPVYTLALGDTTIYKDVYISKVNYNRVAYLGNKFPMEILVKADKCKGQSSKLTVTSGSKQVFTKVLDFTESTFTQTVTLQLDADKSGMMAYRIQLTPVDKENTLANNYREIYVKVIDSRQKVLILANSPNPDIAALKLAMENNSGYDVDSYLIDDFTKSIMDYNLIILHQLPGLGKSSKKITDAIAKSGLPVLYILGSQTDFNAFNSLKTGLNLVVSPKASQNEALPITNNEFSLFTVSDGLEDFTMDLPPLWSPFGTYKTSTSAEILYYQKIGSVGTKQPLIMFAQQRISKTGIVAGEGIWKWKLADYQKNSSHELFNELVGKMAQYLSLKQDSGLFRVICENSFNENESVTFDAELYNESFELINDPEVNLVITNSEKNAYPFVFSRTEKAYRLDAGKFPPGRYTYEARTKLGNKSHYKSGSFVVTALNLEKISSTADHKLLNSISQKHDGKLFYPGQLDELEKTLTAREDIKSVSHIEKRYNEMVNLFWLLVIIIALLSTEWFIRKWSGNY